MLNLTLQVFDSLGGSWNKVEFIYNLYRYRLSPGPTSPEIIPGTTLTAVDLFNRFFTDEIWELLVVEINRYAAISGNTPGTRTWYVSQWRR